MLEADGKISEAADILQDVQVEIVGTMEKLEKADFLLEQIRLTLDKNDFVRAEILCKKVGIYHVAVLSTSKFQTMRSSG